MAIRRFASGRLVWLAMGVIGVMLAGLAALWARELSREPASLRGTVMDPPMQAIEFSLVDQRGRRFTWSEDRGSVTVLSFLYTSCTDVCPLIGAKLKQASRLLGNDGDAVRFVVISTDPQRDSLERIAEYSRAMGMYDRWNFLTGAVPEIQPVWDAYFVAADPGGEVHEPASDEVLEEYGLFRGLEAAEVQQAKAVIDTFGGGYDVGHSSPIWLIDSQDQVRVLHGQDMLPADLVHDIRILLAE